MERHDRDEPRLNMSSVLIALPSFTMPYTERVEPTRRKDRNEAEEPSCEMSNTEQEDPSRHTPYIESEDESRQKPLSEIALPIA
jgi:hypothetical protein